MLAYRNPSNEDSDSIFNYTLKLDAYVLEEGKYQEDGLSIGKGSSMTDPFRNPNAYADYSFLYYETSYKIIKKIWYYGKYKAFQKFGGKTNHKENIVLNAVSFPVQIYWRIKYMKK